MGGIREYVALAKPRVVVMIVVATAAGFCLGSKGSLEFARLLATLAGIGLAAAGTCALNQYIERDADAKMERTRRRPLPGGRLPPAEALAFGAAITVVGLLVLLGVGRLPFLSTFATVTLYLFAYTPLKRINPICLIVGAVPGGLPPLTGWVAARGELGGGAWALLGILFLWQLPHTMAIARLHHQDYRRGGFHMFPERHPILAEIQSLAGCVALLGVSLLPFSLGLVGPVYAVGAAALGLLLLGYGAVEAWSPSLARARALMLVSLAYLPALFILMSFDRV